MGLTKNKMKNLFKKYFYRLRVRAVIRKKRKVKSKSKKRKIRNLTDCDGNVPDSVAAGNNLTPVESAPKASDNAKPDETKTRSNSLTDGGALSNEVKKVEDQVEKIIKEGNDVKVKVNAEINLTSQKQGTNLDKNQVSVSITGAGQKGNRVVAEKVLEIIDNSSVKNINSSTRTSEDLITTTAEAKRP